VFGNINAGGVPKTLFVPQAIENQYNIFILSFFV